MLHVYNFRRCTASAQSETASQVRSNLRILGAILEIHMLLPAGAKALPFYVVSIAASASTSRAVSAANACAATFSRLTLSRNTVTASVKSRSGGYALSVSILTARVASVGHRCAGRRRTEEEVAYAAERDHALELGVAQHLAAHRLAPRVRHLDLLRGRVHGDNARREALLELVGEVSRDGLVDLDVREETVRGGSCVWFEVSIFPDKQRDNEGERI